jgi:hypothetical protein
MRCLSSIVMVLLMLIPAVAQGQDYTATFRYLSVVIRDQLPTVAEAREFQAATDKDAKLDQLVELWMDSEEHKNRVKRHFNDMFGVSPYVFLSDANLDLIQYDSGNQQQLTEAPSDLSTNGVWHLPKGVRATCGTPVSADAWWSESPIMICSTAVSDNIVYSNGAIRCSDPFGANGIINPACGCGPDQILCAPRHLKKNMVVGVAREFAERGYYSYTQGLGWNDLFGGSNFYGDRWLYHHYLWQEKVGAMLELPNATELAFLKGLPTDRRVWVPLPPSSVVRSGIATAPAFLRRFNNFRSRVRALTEQLLCKDVDGSLNVDDYAQFINPDLTDFDRAHGAQESCATCHYSLDNFGSTLLGWSADGYYEKWSPKSQLGHVFGEDGTGPRFLVQSYVDRGTDFNLCMARKTWQEFSGADWSVLSSDDQTALLAAATEGPQEIIRAVLTSNALKKMRLNPPTSVTTTQPVTYDFATDINPILMNSCAGSSCHSSDNPRGLSSSYVGNEAQFKNAPAVRISSGSMPPPGSGRTLTNAEKDKLLIFLGQ